MRNPDLFTLAERRLAWTSERQAVLAHNIANLSTPGFQAMDSPSFQQMLSGSIALQPAHTTAGHLQGTVSPGLTGRPRRDVQARSADGNGIRMEAQLTKVADTGSLQATVAAIYKKYMGMFSTALGKAT